MINILYVIWSLGLGGAEQVVINLAKGLDKTKFQPFVCCLNDEGQFADVLKKEGIQVFALTKARGLDFSVIPKLVKIIKENNIQIVHTHLWGANFWGRMAAKSASVPVVITEHNVDEWKSPLHFLIDRFLFKKTDCFIAVSAAVRSFYSAKLRVPAEKIKVVYNGIQANESQGHKVTKSQVKASLGIKDDEKVIAIIGRLVSQKGHEFFLKAFARLVSSRLSLEDASREPFRQGLASKVKALIVGDGPLKNSLQSTVHSQQLEEKVKFLGLRKDVPEILSITDILVLSSTREGLPMILLEAMAAGVIVVATRVGGTPEVVEDGVNGYLVESGDVEGLRRKIEYVLKADDDSRSNLDNVENSPFRQGSTSLGIDEIRNNARKTVEEKFSLGKMVGEHEEIYLKILSRSPEHQTPVTSGKRNI
ncbi:MAG: glycosyltransferase [Bacteroidota bacterium]